MRPKSSYNSLKFGEIMHQPMHELACILNPDPFSNLAWREVEVRLWSQKHQHRRNNSETETTYKLFSFCFPHNFARHALELSQWCHASPHPPSYTDLKRLLQVPPIHASNRSQKSLSGSCQRHHQTADK